MTARPTRMAELIGDLRDGLDALERGPLIDGGKTRMAITAEVLIARASIVANDDHLHSAALHAAGGRSIAVDDEARPIVVNDPIGEYVAAMVDDGVPTDLVRKETLHMLRRVASARKAIDDARDAMLRAMPPRSTGEPGCRCHAAIGVFEEVHRSERCRFCYDWWRIHGCDPPVEVVRAKADGRKITTKLVREVMADAKRARVHR